ncbi:MAG: hypothetical protein QOJ85_4154 [Solirubrobacteraceae bacterium]|jgi:uncharacterized cupredoxin-like copper-binding protein|nr:hypothetical protein [Solirubrobacteraceae bacterium]
MPRSTTAAALVAIALALGGCGDDEVFRTSRPVLNITLDEYRIVPQNIEVRPGRLKLIVHNTGRLTHNLVIQVPDGPGGKPVPIERVATMQPGQTAAPVKVTLAPGEYRIVCTIANHDDLGQYGTLKVR